MYSTEFNIYIFYKSVFKKKEQKVLKKILASQTYGLVH